MFGPIRMRSDTSGCIWKRLDAFGSIRKCLQFFYEFVEVFQFSAVFGRITIVVWHKRVIVIQHFRKCGSDECR